MKRIIITADVENAAAWEEAFRTHADLFRSQTSKLMHYAVTEDNRVALYTEVEDLDRFQEVIDSEATAEAMAMDGVKRDSVRIYALDKELPL